MLKILQARRAREEEGFTLIELMVVVLIIAILIAIAIPTFLGARSRAQDKNAQSSVRNGITAAKTVFTDSQDYADATIAALTDVEPALTFQANDAASTAPSEVSILVSDVNAAVAGNDRILMVAIADSGNCWAARDTQSGDPATTATEYTEYSGAGDCNADSVSAAAAGEVDWGPEF